MSVRDSPLRSVAATSVSRDNGSLPDNYYELARRGFLTKLLWTAGLAAFGVLPSGCASKWSLLPPRPVSWVMKPLSSARIEETVLPDGRIRLHIEHDLLRGVTPQMLVWWWRNISGEMELQGRSYPRYLIWHPIDHIHFEAITRLPDGSVGPGAVFHIVEALGADMKNLIDARLHLQELHDKGAVVEVRTLGQTVMQIRGQFLLKEGGTQLISTMTLGFSGWWGELGLSQWLVDRCFSPARRKAWLKHSVEEIGNLQFFLPDLYDRHS